MQASLLSMTGYGRGEAQDDSYRVLVEIRSVNSRFLEIRSKLPKNTYVLEAIIREKVQSVLKRGSIEISLIVQAKSPSAVAAVDTLVASAYTEAARKLARDQGMENGLNAAALLRLPGVFSLDESAKALAEKEVEPLLSKALDLALQELVKMRSREGKKLTEVLQRELDNLRVRKKTVLENKNLWNEQYRQKMEKRLADFQNKSKVKLEESRMQQEILFYVDRSDITEELDRLSSHLRQCEKLLEGSATEALGKKLEFLVQEIARETNTMGAKSDQLLLTEQVMEMKLSAERMREQVQNLE